VQCSHRRLHGILHTYDAIIMDAIESGTDRSQAKVSCSLIIIYHPPSSLFAVLASSLRVPSQGLLALDDGGAEQPDEP